MQRLKYITVIALTSILVAGCGGGLPDRYHKQAEQIDEDIKSTGTMLQDKETNYKELKNSGEVSNFNSYAKRANWPNRLDKAKQLQKKARKEYNSELKPLLKKDKESQKKTVLATLKSIRENLVKSRKTTKNLFNQIDRVRTISENTDSIRAEAQTLYDSSTTLYEKAQKKAEAMKQDYPDRSNGIDTRLSDVVDQYAEAEYAYDTIVAEYNADQTDYLIFGRALEDLRDYRRQLSRSVPETVTALGELDRDYTKILADMKIDRYAIVKRWAWNSTDYGSREYTYPAKKISDKSWEYLKDNGYSQALLKVSTGFGGNDASLNVPKKVWDDLGLDRRRSRDRDDDEAEWWLQDIKWKYYQKYTIVENGDTRTTGWKEVSEKEYYDHEDHLGMALATKAKGQFENEAITTPTPPGMNKVGNEKYGEWERTEDGERRWSWGETYLAYHMLSGPNTHYYHRDYRTWRDKYRGRRPYYGGKGNRRWGTYGKTTATRYSKSNAARKKGLRSRSAVRSAGRSMRSGGPRAGGK